MPVMGRTEIENVVRKKVRIGDLLIQEKIITEEQLNKALEKQQQIKGKLGAVLIELGFTTEIEIACALERQLKLPRVQLSGVKIDSNIIKLFSDSSILKKNIVMPFEYDESNSGYLRVAMADPMDIMAIDDIEIVTNAHVIPVIATTQDILVTIDKYFGNAEAKAVAEQYTQERASQYHVDNQEEAVSADVENSPIVILVKKIIEQAVRQRASDIHIEPLETRIRVRYRVDGSLIEVGIYSNDMLSAIVARLKIIGGMDISEKRKPQDGRITQVVDRIEYDIRVSSLPTVYGEKIVLRLTAKKALTKDKRLLGFTLDELKKFDKILSHPHGIILVTGPTGSGKSTTLYTVLSELNKEDVNIVTVEDPVEANIDGVNQIQVNPKAELTFASALRSILRQDPDIIMIGEIRDGETASIAVTASITGHLVVSTVHTNSAVSTITRLVDMGVEPYLLADSVVGVIAQRLVRRLCSCCRIREADSIEKSLMNIPNEETVMIKVPVGCTKCNETGYYGRIGVYEIMPISYHMKGIIARSGTAEEIQEAALKDGFTTLFMSAVKLVVDGVTSVEEMRRITYFDEDE